MFFDGHIHGGINILVGGAYTWTTFYVSVIMINKYSNKQVLHKYSNSDK